MEKKKNIINKNLPNILYRFFEKEEYALDFIKGHIRFTNQNECKEMKYPRGDPTERISSLKYPAKIQTLHIDKNTMKCINSTYSNGFMNWSGGLLNSVFVLCACLPNCDMEKLKKELKSPFVVQMNNPQEFLSRIEKSYNEQYNSNKKRIIHNYVSYTKGQQSKKPHPGDSWYLSIFQKPDKYSYQKEYRFAILLHNISSEQEFIKLNINNCEDICVLIENKVDSILIKYKEEIKAGKLGLGLRKRSRPLRVGYRWGMGW
jgi:hypothetical protein